MAFLRNLLATLLGLFIFTFLGFVFLVVIASASEDAPSVESNSILYLPLSGMVVERAIDDPFRDILRDGPAAISLVDLLDALEKAKVDDRIRGIYLESRYLVAGQSSLQEIRDALIDFKSSGKFIYAYGEYISEGDYYLMSVADEIYLNPEGSLEFNGLNANVTFFKGLFDKLDIEPEVFRVGEYKSFVEPFVRKSMSEENRLQLSALINSVYDFYLTNVSESRNRSFEELKNTSDNMLVRFPEDAVERGLATKIAYEDEMKKLIRQQLEIDEDDDIPTNGVQRYIQAVKAERTEYSGNKIAVIVADGDIVMRDAEDAVGGEQFAREIRNARENESVKAIVLRVNSPGGSLTASDMIWREVQLTRGVKPIIASLSNVAASGGYYISVGCDTIVAQPNTITGSIGIFGLLFNFGEFLENKLGITTDNVKTGEFSDLITVTRSLTEYERQIIQNQVEEGYRTFTTKVAEGRDMPLEEVLEVAGGRVWSGEQARELGLVDVLGSFDDAVRIAAEKAGVEDDYRLSFYPRQKPFFEELLSRVNDEAEANFLGGKEHILTPYIEQVESLQQMKGIQVRLPGNLQIK